jgi:hypothetical protein
MALLCGHKVILLLCKAGGTIKCGHKVILLIQEVLPCGHTIVPSALHIGSGITAFANKLNSAIQLLVSWLSQSPNLMDATNPVSVF